MPILWAGVERSIKEPSMTIRKRLRVLFAALTQTWHQKTCAECKATWMAVGPPTELIAICDRCELEELDRFAAAMNRKYQDEMKGVGL